MLKKTILLSGLLFQSQSASAAGCLDLKTCAKAVFDLTGERYFWEADAEKAKISAAPDIEITRENADVLFTALLDEAGMARAPVGDGKTYRVVPGKARREMDTPVFDASAETSPRLPATWDWVTLRYRPRTRELTETFEELFRLHLPRDARLEADFNGGVVLVTAPAPTARHLVELFRGADVPPSAAVKKHFEELERKKLAIMERERRK